MEVSRKYTSQYTVSELPSTEFVVLFENMILSNMLQVANNLKDGKFVSS